MTAIQEATKVNYDYRNQNGAGVWLPPNVEPGLNNLKRIDPYNDSITQLYPIGTIGYLDQRKFAYSKAGDTITGIARLLVDENDLPGTSSHEDHEGWEGYVYAIVAEDATVVDIENTTAEPKNYYAGSYFTVFNADGIKTTTIRIAASDLGDGSNVRLYLDNGLPWALVEHDWCNVYMSPYSNVTLPDSDHFEAFVGLSLIAVTTAYYFWLQIAGPCWIAQFSAATLPGYAAKYRDVWAHQDGTIRSDNQSGLSQRVGYGLGSTAGASGGDSYIMLQMG